MGGPEAERELRGRDWSWGGETGEVDLQSLHSREFDLSLQPELSDESLAWAESQLTLGLLEEGDGEGGQAQLLLRSVREASLQQLRLPSAPAGLVEAGGGVSPIDLAVQLLSELEELATLHQRSEWLKTRLQAHR